MKRNFKTGDIVKDEKGNLYKVLSLTSSLFIFLEDLKTNQLVLSSGDYYINK
jgi:hypothetical protein